MCLEVHVNTHEAVEVEVVGQNAENATEVEEAAEPVDKPVAVVVVAAMDENRDSPDYTSLLLQTRHSTNTTSQANTKSPINLHRFPCTKAQKILIKTTTYMQQNNLNGREL